MLKRSDEKLYKVHPGETLEQLAARFGVTAYQIVAENRLNAPLYAGQVLLLPKSTGVYTVQAGDTKALVCGSDEVYRTKNGTDVFYPGMRVRL